MSANPEQLLDWVKSLMAQPMTTKRAVELSNGRYNRNSIQSTISALYRKGVLMRVGIEKTTGRDRHVYLIAPKAPMKLRCKVKRRLTFVEMGEGPPDCPRWILDRTNAMERKVLRAVCAADGGLTQTGLHRCIGMPVTSLEMDRYVTDLIEADCLRRDKSGALYLSRTTEGHNGSSGDRQESCH